MKLVILDRDGVINEDSESYIKSPDEWHPIPGSLEAISNLNQHGFRVIVATNQSGVGRGLFEMSALNEIHARMHRAVASVGGKIDAVFFCPHTPEDNCPCRKPKPGMFDEISARFGIDLSAVPTIGDTRRDLEAGQAAGCSLMLVRTGKGRRTIEAGALPSGTVVFDDLAHAATAIVAAVGGN